jgi:class 3 adenylate cyclase
MVTSNGVRWLADRLPTATLKLVRSHAPLTGFLPFDDVLDEIEEFLSGTRVGGGARRQLATLLVTDIVGSSETAASGGDLTWKHLLSTHRDAVRRALARFGGAEIDTAGDGFLASFSLPSAALRCAADVTTHSRALGVEVRAGIHTGEVLLEPPGVIGLAVHVAARVAALAGPSEILLTDTVRSTLIGSDLGFEPAGQHDLKGIPGRWQLHRLATTTPEAPDAR